MAELSPHQRQVWRIERIVRGQTYLHTDLVLRLTGTLDPVVLQEALQAVQQRHELLRSGFLADGEELAVVAQAPPSQLRVVTADPADLDDPGRLGKILTELNKEPFPLDGGALLRLTAVTAGAGQHALVITVHRLISDAVSLQIITRDLAAAAAGNLPSGQAASYFENMETSEEHLAADHDYWSATLADYPLIILGDRQPPDEWEPDGRIVEVRVPGLIETVTARQASERATPFVLVTAAIFGALSAASGLADLCIGTAFENRLRMQTREIIGPLAQAMLLRITAADASPQEVVTQVKAALKGAVAHQRMPFDDVMAMVVASGVAQESMLPVVLAVKPEREPLPVLAGMATAHVRLEDSDDLIVRPAQLDLEVELRSPEPLIRATYDGAYMSEHYVRGVIDGVLARLTP